MKLLFSLLLSGISCTVLAQPVCQIVSQNINQDFCTICSSGPDPALVDGVFTGTLEVYSTYTISASCLSGIYFASNFTISMDKDTDLIFGEDPQVADGTSVSITVMQSPQGGYIHAFGKNYVPVKNNNPDNYDDLAALMSSAANNRAVVPEPQALPVTLVKWQASVAENAVALTWRTAGESSNDFFIVEHSVNGLHFSPLAERSGATDGEATIDYTYRHATPSPGTNFYRLVQYDLDGSATLFPVVSAYFRNDRSATAIYPNPATPGNAIHITADDQSAPVALFTLNGRKIAGLVVGSSTELSLPPDLPPGMYILRIGTHSQRLAVR
ncbi:T9SS type A sorting domain-containing protein [Neolewinella litorea]|uniref:T9SS type A sorting domain-containing protein n=1 Tax=Neolewinella litorea TaxID=2562452 RepID=A0A4S4NKM8_9BACT|nr:T9SS type A sorting domain-containing protein [Neolewinella litorea]THH40434.1 T9SS type A sorting domain-containing protein [Neolewinella litorea]